MYWDFVEKKEYDEKVVELRESLKLPYTAKNILQDSLNQLNNLSRSLTLHLPETKFVDEVIHYSERSQVLTKKLSYPKLKKTIGLPAAKDLSTRLNIALRLIDLSKTVDKLIEPIILYYGCVQLCGIFTRAYFDWENDRQGHGVSFVLSNEGVGEVSIKIEDHGMFPRLAATCFLRSGYPSCFTRCVTYLTKPISHNGPGEQLEHFGKCELGDPLRKITLQEIANFDYAKHVKKVLKKHGFHQFNGLTDTAFLIDIITLYLASMFARYNTLRWQEILDGETNPYRLHFDQTFERFRNFTTDRIVLMIGDVECQLDSWIGNIQCSPYSERDKRFKNHPNYD